MAEDRDGALRIRDYRSADHAAVLALQAAADADLGALVPDDFYRDLQQVETTYAGGAFLIAEVSGHVAGMGGLLRTGEVVRMRVDAGFRRRGVARQLLEALLLRARRLGMARVFLHTLTMQHAAQNLYVQAGFHKVGRGEVHGNAVIAYEKWL